MNEQENNQNMDSAVSNAISGITRTPQSGGNGHNQTNQNQSSPGRKRPKRGPGGPNQRSNQGGGPSRGKGSGGGPGGRGRGGGGGKGGGRPSMGGLMQSVSKGPSKDSAHLAASSSHPRSGDLSTLDNQDSGMLYPASKFQEQPRPVARTDHKLRIIPMGGLGEVGGMNCMALEYGNDIIIVDVGWMFPDETMPGIDYVIPDVTYLEKKKQNIRGIIITHAHLDHIGAAPYILPKLGFPPIYATQLTGAFMQGPLEEHGILNRAKFQTIRYDDVLQIGAFKVEFAHVNHSIPEGLAIAVTTSVGTVVHSGDFKFDATPVADQPAEFEKLKSWGKRGILLAMCDSTNVERPGHTPSELEIGKNLNEQIAGAQGRVILSTVSSLISRLQSALHAARDNNRKVTIVGRSMLKNLEISQRLGYIDIPKDILVDSRSINRIPDNQLLIICTGAQANEMSAMLRMAAGEHKQVEIKQGDTVIVSSSPIPGNERAVQGMMDDLFRRGADVIYSKLFDIHSSGHAFQDELVEMLEMLKPQHYLPIHGEYRHRVLNGRLATSIGVAPNNIHLLDNGKVLEATADGIVGMTKESVGGGMVFVDGLGVGDVGNIVLRDRKHMSEDGMCVIIVTVERKSGRLIGSPDIISRGFIYLRDAGELLNDTRNQVRKQFQDHAKGHHNSGKRAADWSYLKNKVRDDVGEYLYAKTERRPMILPVVIEV